MINMKRLTPEEFLNEFSQKDDKDVHGNLRDGLWTNNVLKYMQAYADHCEESAWVSVDERLPEFGQKVLVFRDGRHRDFPVFSDSVPSVFDGGRFMVYKDVCVGDRVLASYYGGITHWRPFPNPPRQ